MGRGKRPREGHKEQVGGRGKSTTIAQKNVARPPQRPRGEQVLCGQEEFVRGSLTVGREMVRYAPARHVCLAFLAKRMNQTSTEHVQGHGARKGSHNANRDWLMTATEALAVLAFLPTRYVRLPSLQMPLLSILKKPRYLLVVSILVIYLMAYNFLGKGSFEHSH